jgi:hypothetical protein
MILADSGPVSPLFLWPIFCLTYAATTVGFTVALVLMWWRKRTGRTAQQVSRWRLRAALLLWAPVVIRLAVPCPIRGHYIGNLTASTEVGVDTSVRFSDGRADFHSKGDLREHGGPPIEPWGRYQKTGWNTYVLTEADPEPGPNGKLLPITLHAGWFFLKLNYAPESRRVMKEDYLYRDFLLFRWMP